MLEVSLAPLNMTLMGLVQIDLRLIPTVRIIRLSIEFSVINPQITQTLYLLPS